MSDLHAVLEKKARGIPGAAVRIALAGQQTLQGAATLKQELLHGLTEQADISIDLTAVEAIDAAALQLILSARVSAQAAGQSLTVLCPAGSPAARHMSAMGFRDFADFPPG